MNKNNANKSTIFFVISLCMFIYSALVLVVCIIFRNFAELYCRTFSYYLRIVLSRLFGVFSFSVAELTVVVLPAVVLVIILLIIMKRTKFKSVLKNTFALLFVLFFLFVNAFGVCYLRNPVEDNMGFSVNKTDVNDLKNYAVIIRELLEKSADNVVFSDDYSSENPHKWDDLCALVDEGYNVLEKQYPFISDIDVKAKKIYLSEYLTYTHISGMYFPFTSEANVNTNYPEYVVAYSLAHEKAHQRGIAGEDEANFVAFLACMNSDNEYLEYSALMSMYEYFLDAIYMSEPAAYVSLIESTDKRILGEMYAYSVFFDKYRDSNASKVADVVNDTYIKSMGDSRGVESYSRVVELCVSYFKEYGIEL